MSSSHTIRQIDALGRVVLPLEARQALMLERNDAVEIFLDANERLITLKKVAPVCTCCQATENLKALPGGKFICAACLAQVH